MKIIGLCSRRLNKFGIEASNVPRMFDARAAPEKVIYSFTYPLATYHKNIKGVVLSFVAFSYPYLIGASLQSDMRK